MAKKIHVVADTVRSEGGYAVIRLDGVWLLQKKATVCIRPLDQEGSAKKGGWPGLEQVPIDVRTTSRGIELVVGPEVVDSEALQPGRRVGISVPAGDISGEIIWPDIPKSAGAAALADSNTTADISRPVGTSRVSVLNGAATAATNETSASNGLASLQLAKYNAAFRNGAHRASAPGEPLFASNKGSLASAQSAKREAKPAWDPNFHALERTSEKLSTAVKPAPTDSPEVTARIAANETVRFSPLGLFAAGFLATGIVLAFAWLNVSTDTRPQQELSLAEIFSIGDISPRRIDARSFDRDDALLLANQFIHGIERPADRDEAAYWLRKALSLKLSNEQMTWALTQLGTIYANTDKAKPADYRSAKMLWELAGANGDPVSLCFLGHLYESGLGVPASLDKARAHYERAMGLGGCPGLKAALVRVGK